MDFSDITWLLLYYPSDKDSKYIPFMLTHVAESSWNEEIYNSVIENPLRITTVLVDWNGSHKSGIVVQCGSSAESLYPAEKYCSEAKQKRRIPIQQLLTQVERFVPSKRQVFLPINMLQYDSVAESTEWTDVEAECSVPRPSDSSIRFVSLPPEPGPSDVGLQLLPYPAILTTSEVSPKQKSEGALATSEVPQNVFRKLSEVKKVGTPDLSKINNMVKKAGYEPFTMEGTYYLSAIVLRELSVLKGPRLEAKTKGKEPRAHIETQTTLDGFKGLMSKIKQDEEFRASATDFLSTIGGTSLRKCVVNMMNAFMTNDIQKLFNRPGAYGKRSFQPHEDVFRVAARRCFPQSTEHDITLAIVAALKNAVDRYGGRQKRKAINDARNLNENATC